MHLITGTAARAAASHRDKRDKRASTFERFPTLHSFPAALVHVAAWMYAGAAHHFSLLRQFVLRWPCGACLAQLIRFRNHFLQLPLLGMDAGRVGL